jgi:hypothetical protein
LLPKDQLYVVKISLQRPSSTACVIALIYNRYSDPYKPGTKRERAYIAAILSIYQDDYKERSIIIDNTIKKLISKNAEFKLDKLYNIRIALFFIL